MCSADPARRLRHALGGDQIFGHPRILSVACARKLLVRVRRISSRRLHQQWALPRDAFTMYPREDNASASRTYQPLFGTAAIPS